MLHAEIARRLGGLDLAVTLAVPDASVLALVGESGAGKSTVLRLLAGLLDPDHGRISLDGVVLFDGGTGARVPAPARSVGYVPQDYALFPHLSVFENVAFGLRARGIGGTALGSRVDRALERLDMGRRARAKPQELSGGQQQRVALARALVLEPRLLLLDEPLSALDRIARREIRGELARLLRELPCVTIYVTHNPDEALALGQRIAVLEDGRISQEGSRADLFRHPRSRYVAEFLGVNFFRGTVVRREPGALAWVAVGSGELAIVDPGCEGEVTLVLHPREITLSREPPEGSARNVLRGRIEEVVPEPPAGELMRVLVASDPPLAAEVTRASVEALELRAGDTTYASFKATGVTIVP